jgi:ribosome-interacting GTPase 1
MKGPGSNSSISPESSKVLVKVHLSICGPILPITDSSQGRGRGRQVVSTAKTADLILIMLDATKSDEQRRLLEIELDAVGIRLNKKKPDVVFKRKTTGGVRPTSG